MKTIAYNRESLRRANVDKDEKITYIDRHESCYSIEIKIKNFKLNFDIL